MAKTAICCPPFYPQNVPYYNCAYERWDLLGPTLERQSKSVPSVTHIQGRSRMLKVASIFNIETGVNHEQ